MALHPLKLPRCAAILFRVIALQKRLLRALTDPALVATAVNTAWVQSVWRDMNAQWVQKFCLRGQEARLRTIALAPLAARRALFEEFCRQNKVPAMVNSGGDFRDLLALPAFNAALANTVKEFFADCYDLLGQSSRTGGYSFGTRKAITKSRYSDEFRDANPTKVVCPYCDGDIGTPELDHYYCKSHFPLLACSPWNIVPVCKSCNDTTIAKGNRLALSPGPPRCSTDWLHPLMCPASDSVRIELTGNPRKAIPKLCSVDRNEQRRLDNHHWLLDRLDQPNPSRYLSNRWTRAAAAYFEVLLKIRKSKSIDEVIKNKLDDHECSRGLSSSSMVQAAVCSAILNGQQEYREEFTDSNPPVLA